MMLWMHLFFSSPSTVLISSLLLCVQQVDDVQSRMAEHGNDIPIGIGEQSYIRKAIIDKNARIGKNVKVLTNAKRFKLFQSCTFF